MAAQGRRRPIPPPCARPRAPAGGLARRRGRRARRAAPSRPRARARGSPCTDAFRARPPRRAEGGLVTDRVADPTDTPADVAHHEEAEPPRRLGGPYLRHAAALVAVALVAGCAAVYGI